jgi:formylglycine-generating enzyme required for sulfatase activity
MMRHCVVLVIIGCGRRSEVDLGNHRSDTDSSVVTIPAGEYILGCSPSECESSGERTARVREIRIDVNKVTKQMYIRCTLESACPPLPIYPGLAPSNDSAEVVRVEPKAAHAYCHWKGGRLPTEDEWEAAGRGHTRWPYPWGSSWDPNRIAPSVTIRLSPNSDMYYGYTRGGQRPNSRSSLGVEDLVGNVAEFVEVPGTGLRIKGRPLSRTSDPREFVLGKTFSVTPTDTAGFRCAYD